MSAISTFATQMWVRAQILRNDKGQGLVEYGLVVALIAVVSILVLEALGIDIFNALDATQENIPDNATPSAPTAS
jgi:Flp pilus assembly pilin Flp